MLDKIKIDLKSKSNSLLGYESMSEYAILVPIVKQADGSLAILFEKRAHKMRRQPGEISFPGGKIEKSDQDARHAALREACEELGIAKDNIEILNRLGLFVSSRLYVIHPYVAYINTTNFSPNPDEVEDILLIPLDFFLNNEPDSYKVRLVMEPEESFPFHLIPNGKDYEWGTSQIEEYFYQYENSVVWGMTAHILYHFIQTIK